MRFDGITTAPPQRNLDIFLHPNPLAPYDLSQAAIFIEVVKFGFTSNSYTLVLGRPC